MEYRAPIYSTATQLCLIVGVPYEWVDNKRLCVAGCLVNPGGERQETRDMTMSLNDPQYGDFKVPYVLCLSHSTPDIGLVLLISLSMSMSPSHISPRKGNTRQTDDLEGLLRPAHHHCPPTNREGWPAMADSLVVWVNVLRPHHQLLVR